MLTKYKTSTVRKAIHSYITENGVSALFDPFNSWYAHNTAKRYYHNAKHADMVSKALFEICEPSVELVLAAIWHDAVYVPGAGSDANERCSAAALKAEFKNYERQGFIKVGLDFDKEFGRVCELIIGTNVQNHLAHEMFSEDFGQDLKILLDADLYSLASDYETFVDNQRNIILENYGDPLDKNSIQMSSNFLKMFLTTRPFIYHTLEARTIWEAKARENIMKYTDEHN